MIFQLKKEIKTFDVIHIHCYRSFQSIIIHHYAKKYAIPYVVQAHGGLPTFKEKGRTSRVYDKLFGNKLLRDASTVIALTEKEAKEYEGMGVPIEKISILPNGIDLSEYANLPKVGSFKNKLDLTAEVKIVLYLARINKIKGIDILVCAFANIANKIPGLKLVIVGPDDGYLCELKALIRTLKIDEKVIISGPLYGRDKLEAYVDADAYVLPSRYETFPLSILEALACGTPIVLTENCEIAESLKGKVGLVVKPEVNCVEEALLEILSNESQMLNFKLNSKNAVKQFNISESISRLEDIYAEVISRRMFN